MQIDFIVLYGQSCLGTSQAVPVTSQLGQSLLGNNQPILLMIKKRKILGRKTGLDNTFQLVSLIWVAVGTSLGRLKLVGFAYLLVRRCKDIAIRY